MESFQIVFPLIYLQFNLSFAIGIWHHTQLEFCHMFQFMILHKKSFQKYASMIKIFITFNIVIHEHKEMNKFEVPVYSNPISIHTAEMETILWSLKSV